MIKIPIVVLSIVVVFSCSCSPCRVITKTADINPFSQDVFENAHTGISVYDVAADKYLYNYQGNKYFVPASNTKLFTLYAGMKYLKDSLPGLRFTETADTLYVYPTGDPSLLHPDFKKQPVIEALKKTKKTVVIIDNWKEEALGKGWSWDDYNDDYMAERSALPVYGNVIKWVQITQKNTQQELQDSLQTFVFSEPEINWKVRFKEDPLNKVFDVKRKRDENYFEVTQGKEAHREQFVPFVTNGLASAIELLKDTIQKELIVRPGQRTRPASIIYSQPSDSLFKTMMYRSDNFFAEQTLLMVSDEKTASMNEGATIDSLLKFDLKDLPQKPTWVDGSGLSRYNLFTPMDFVWLLNRMKNDFGMSRMKAILPGGGQGTFKNYFREDSGYIFAKTGTLTGVVALSGYLITSSNKLLIFSVLVNNHHGSAAIIRRSVEALLHNIRMKY